MERFAPGFSDIVVAARSIPAAQLADHNANYVGGDIGVGGNSVVRALLGPTPRINPWSTPIPEGLPVLVGDPARRRRARHGRLLRRAHGAQARVRAAGSLAHPVISARLSTLSDGERARITGEC